MNVNLDEEEGEGGREEDAAYGSSHEIKSDQAVIIKSAKRATLNGTADQSDLWLISGWCLSSRAFRTHIPVCLSGTFLSNLRWSCKYPVCPYNMWHINYNNVRIFLVVR
jgi:hypothetical protein